MSSTPIEQALIHYKARKIPGRSYMKRAGVAILLNQREDKIQTLLIKRATRSGDPWSGDMAFPGGCMSADDSNIFDATLRELYEEVGAPQSSVRYLGRLSDQLARSHHGYRPMAVTPFVFRLTDEPQWVLNHEVDDLLWIPLDYFTNPSNRKQMEWQWKGMTLKLPCYYYEGCRIWGMTLRKLDELTKFVI